MTKKFSLAYNSISSIILSLLAYGSNLVTENLFIVYWIIAGLFLLFGIIHLIVVNSNQINSNANEGEKVIKEILFGILIVFAAIIIFSSLQYFIRSKDYLFFPMLCSCLAFFIPSLIFHTFNAAFNIPKAIFKTWSYPLNEQIQLPEENPSERVYMIGFEIAKKNYDTIKTYFIAKAPAGMNLGDLYYFFINDYNELQSETPIEYTSNNNIKYEWWFRRKHKWYQFEKILNPDITVRENDIKEHTVIICERIKIEN